MAHPNARLTPRARLEMVRQMLAGWPIAEVARQFRVLRATVTKWLRRWAGLVQTSAIVLFLLPSAGSAVAGRHRPASTSEQRPAW